MTGILLLLAGTVPLVGTALGATSITGTVVDPGTGQGVPQARVQVCDATVAVSTDAAGVFELTRPDSGALSLCVTHPDYVRLRFDVTPSMAPEAPLQLRLQRAEVRLHEELVVLGRRGTAPSFTTARALTVVGEGVMDSGLSRTTPEALAAAEGVWLQKTNHGGGSPFVRGLTGNQVLILLDGIPLNNATYRYGPNQYLATIDPASVEHIEVARGLGSVLYGSDALGGVINVVSKGPALGGTRFGGVAHSKWISSGMEKSAHLDLFASGSRAAVRGGLSLRDFGDLRAGGGLGFQRPSGYGEWAGHARALLRLSDQHVLNLAFQHVRQDDVPRYDQVAPARLCPLQLRPAGPPVGLCPPAIVVSGVLAQLGPVDGLPEPLRRAPGTPAQRVHLAAGRA